MINNFLIESNNERYQTYLNDYLLKYVKDKEKVNEYIVTTDSKLYGLNKMNDSIICRIPKRITLFDEMISIHEISHLIGELNLNAYLNFKAREIIPFFNEYNYLLLENESLAIDYIDFRKHISNSLILKDKEDDISLGYIYAYLVLKKRINDFNIDELNKINAKSKNIEKRLQLKRYTI